MCPYVTALGNLSLSGSYFADFAVYNQVLLTAVKKQLFDELYLGCLSTHLLCSDSVQPLRNYRTHTHPDIYIVCNIKCPLSQLYVQTEDEQQS